MGEDFLPGAGAGYSPLGVRQRLNGLSDYVLERRLDEKNIAVSLLS